MNAIKIFIEQNISKIKNLLILDAIEYCFSIDYDRWDGVIGKEYESFKKSVDSISNYNVELLIAFMGEDYFKDLMTAQALTNSNERLTELRTFIKLCDTASIIDKENALALFETLTLA